MAPGKPRSAKAQTVTPCSSPTSKAAKTAGKLVAKSPQAGISAETQTTVDKEVELAPSGKDIMAAIKACSETLTAKIDALAVDINIMRHEFNKVKQKISEMEVQVSKVEDKVKTDDREWHILRKQMNVLQDRAIDTESRLRRNNIRIIGLPERVEGDNPTEFSEKLLINILGLQHLCLKEHTGFIFDHQSQDPPRSVSSTSTEL